LKLFIFPLTRSFIKRRLHIGVFHVWY